MPTEFVRIRDTENKTEVSVSRPRAEQLAGRGGVEILDGVQAADRLGRPLPPSKVAEEPPSEAEEPPGTDTGRKTSSKATAVPAAKGEEKTR